MNVYYFESEPVEMVDDIIGWTEITHSGVFIGFVVAPHRSSASKIIIQQYPEIRGMQDIGNIIIVGTNGRKVGHVDYDNAPVEWQKSAFKIQQRFVRK